MRILKASDIRSIITEPPEGFEELMSFLESINVRFASQDDENWTVDWSHMGVGNMDCRGGDFAEVWTRLLRDLADYRVNGNPIVIFAALNA